MTIEITIKDRIVGNRFCLFPNKPKTYTNSVRIYGSIVGKFLKALGFATAIIIENSTYYFNKKSLEKKTHHLLLNPKRLTELEGQKDEKIANLLIEIEKISDQKFKHLLPAERSSSANLSSTQESPRPSSELNSPRLPPEIEEAYPDLAREYQERSDARVWDEEGDLLPDQNIRESNRDKYGNEIPHAEGAPLRTNKDDSSLL